MGKDSNSTASLEEAVETTTNEVVDAEVVSDENTVVDSKEEVTAPKGKTAKVKFLLSPVGKFGLAYISGETGTFTKQQATELVDAKYAEFVK